MGALTKSKESLEDSVKYAQQHLANERTYLAWLRTAISTTGVGFLTTSLHFTINLSANKSVNKLAIFLGILACVIGFATSILSTIQYTKKRKDIQKGIFIPSNKSVLLVSILFSTLIIIIFFYLLVLLLFKS